MLSKINYSFDYFGFVSKFYINLISIILFNQKADVKGDILDNWNYGRRGPDVWNEEIEECRGFRQSPINIDPNNVVFNPNLRPFDFGNYDIPVRWNFTNDGRTSMWILSSFLLLFFISIFYFLFLLLFVDFD